jgi:hypothetical protein
MRLETNDAWLTALGKINLFLAALVTAATWGNVLLSPIATSAVAGIGGMGFFAIPVLTAVVIGLLSYYQSPLIPNVRTSRASLLLIGHLAFVLGHIALLGPVIASSLIRGEYMWFTLIGFPLGTLSYVVAIACTVDLSTNARSAPVESSIDPQAPRRSPTAAIVALATVLLISVFVFWRPVSADKAKELATDGYRSFARSARIDPEEFQGPVLEREASGSRLFVWSHPRNRAARVEVSISKNGSDIRATKEVACFSSPANRAANCPTKN